MQVSEVLNYIPKEELDRLSLEYKVDYQVKKLHGQTMFQLLLFSMLPRWCEHLARTHKAKQNPVNFWVLFYTTATFLVKKSLNFLPQNYKTT